MLTANYHQGHYWHKGKDNTFEKEGGHMRNGGKMAGLDKVFKELGADLTEKALKCRMFTLRQLQ